MSPAPASQRLYLDTGLGRALAELFQSLEHQLGLTRPVNVYIAGGIATHLYTGSRFTTDVDAEFDARVVLPADMAVTARLEDGRDQLLYLDTNYNPTFALMHEDYRSDALPIDMGTSALKIHVLSPVDLAVSKLSRFADNDQEDIVSLVRCGLVSSKDIAHRAQEAMGAYVGNTARLLGHLDSALSLIRAAEASRREHP